MKHIYTYISLTTLVVFFVFLYARAYIVAPVYAASGINRSINFQGKLTNTDGTNVTDGSYTVVFKMYEEASAGTALWTETDTVTTTSGIFHVALGATTPIPTNISFNWDGLYLGMKVGSDAEMTPRIQMTAVPYAFNAEKVSGLTVQDASGNASTSGVLKVANAKTLTFNGDFTISGVSGLTFATTGTTSLTLPAVTDTVAVLGADQSFTGSNTFSGITLASGTSYSQTGNGTFSTGTGALSLNGDVTLAASKFLRLTGGAGDPTATNGILWYDTTANKFKIVENGTVKILCNTTDAGCGTGGAAGANYLLQVNGNGVTTGGYTAIGNLTTDFLIGGVSTAAAKFAFINTTGTLEPTASIAGQITLRNSVGYINRLNGGDITLQTSVGGDGGLLPRFTLKNNGNIGIGTTAPTYPVHISLSPADKSNGAVLYIDGTYSAGSSNSLSGVRVAPTFRPNGASSQTYSALSFAAISDTANLSAGGVLAGVFGGAYFDADNVSNTTLQNGVGGQFNVIAANFTGSSNTTITNAYALIALNAQKQCTGTCTITGGVGMRIDDQSVATSNTDLLIGQSTIPTGNFAIYNASTYVNYLAANVGIGNTAPVEKLDVKGNVQIDAQTNSMTAISKISQTQAGQIASNGTTLIASVSASAVYNGSLYVGTGRGSAAPSGGAEVYRYNGASGNWTVLNATAGTLNTTANIASISAMIVYNGNLYVGTFKTGAAEVYRYDGGSTWTRVSHPSTAGTIAGTSAIDGVTSMAVMGGKLFIGTKKVTGAQVFRYDGNYLWTALNTTAGQFDATNKHIDAVTSMTAYNNTLYIGTSRGTNAEIYRMIGIPTGTAATLVSGIGTICTTTLVNAISTLTVYNGKLYAGTWNGTNGADVCRYDDNTGSAGTLSTTWTRVNNTAGKMTFGGTASIIGIDAMVVYNGRLYVGTEKAGAGEVYQYVDGDVWTQINGSGFGNGSAGTIATGGTTAIDKVSTLIQYNSTLYIGTSVNAVTASFGGEVYTYSTIADQSYALKFNAASQTGGGQQNGLLNNGAIWFEASPSGQVTTGNATTGSFLFSHGLITGAGAYDVAEDYPTRDSSIEAGDLVSIDTNETAFVSKTSTAYDSKIVGVYSAHPGFLLSQLDNTIDGAGVVPVALVGRVSVKVSSENGFIAPGDYLTSSSIPGVAMKATKPGQTVGRAMQEYTGDGVGRITVFVNMSYVNPAAAVVAGMSVDDTSSIGMPDEATTPASASSSAVLPDDLHEKYASLSARMDSLEGKFASASALAMTPTTGVLSASVSALLDPYNLSDHSATISGDLLVSGRTLLSDVGITGNISAGLLTIKGLDSEINSIAGPLKLQNGTLDGLEFVGGAVTIDPKGNIITKASVTTTKLTITTDDAHLSIGKGLLKKGETAVIIETPSVTKDSDILVTPKVFSDQLVVTKQDSGKSFTVEMEHASSKDIPFDWWVVN